MFSVEALKYKSIVIFGKYKTIIVWKRIRSNRSTVEERRGECSDCSDCSGCESDVLALSCSEVVGWSDVGVDGVLVEARVRLIYRSVSALNTDKWLRLY